MRSFDALAVLASLALARSQVAGSGPVPLTAANFSQAVFDTDKFTFVKFLAPWCGQCKKLKPDWDKLAADFNTPNSYSRIANVDCSEEHSTSLCKQYKVESYPTLKYFFKGFSKEGEAYDGPREYQEMKKFVKDHSRPHCSYATLQHCSKEEKAFVAEVRDWDTTKITAWYTQSKDEAESVKGKADELAEKIAKKQREVLNLHEKEQKARKKADDVAWTNIRKMQILAQHMAGQMGKVDNLVKDSDL